jgi:hypothetical protein
MSLTRSHHQANEHYGCEGNSQSQTISTFSMVGPFLIAQGPARLNDSRHSFVIAERPMSG